MDYFSKYSMNSDYFSLFMPNMTIFGKNNCVAYKIEGRYSLLVLFKLVLLR